MTLAEAIAVARDTLAQPQFASLESRLPAGLRTPGGCREALQQVGFAPSTTAALAAQRPAGAEPFERWLLLNASLAAAEQLPRWPVDESVRSLWVDEMLFFAQAGAAAQSMFALSGVRFREMARIATLRRYPAGQFHWEPSGWPRSHLFHTPPRQWPAMLGCLVSAGGFAPMAETHLNDRRKNRLTLTESEGVLSYYRLARSLEFQPEIRGLFTASWLYCRTTAEVTPRLAWLRRVFEENGAFLGSIGPAPPDSGFLTGSEDRRKLYEEGRYRPEMTYVVWPRRSMLDWAGRSY